MMPRTGCSPRPRCPSSVFTLEPIPLLYTHFLHYLGCIRSIPATITFFTAHLQNLDLCALDEVRGRHVCQLVNERSPKGARTTDVVALSSTLGGAVEHEHAGKCAQQHVALHELRVVLKDTALAAGKVVQASSSTERGHKRSGHAARTCNLAQQRMAVGRTQDDVAVGQVVFLSGQDDNGGTLACQGAHDVGRVGKALADTVDAAGLDLGELRKGANLSGVALDDGRLPVREQLCIIVRLPITQTSI